MIFLLYASEKINLNVLQREKKLMDILRLIKGSYKSKFIALK